MSKTTKSIISLWFMALAITILGGCNSYPSKNQPEPTSSSYVVAGVTVIDPNRDTTIVLGEFLKDSAVLSTGSIVFGLDSLKFDATPFTLDSVYARMFTVAVRYTAGSYQLIFADSSNFSDTTLIAVPGTYILTSVTPTNRIVNGNENVSLDWSGASGATTYAIAAVLKNSRYLGQGFSEYVTSGVTAMTFNRDAFYPTGGTLPDTGWYYLYVYALTGSPDSALSETALPVPLPSQLADNISGLRDAGHWGTVRVLARDSVQVVAQP